MESKPGHLPLLGRESLSLKDVFDMLFRQKHLVMWGTLLIAGVLVVYALVSKPKFDSEMLVLVKNDRPDPVSTGNQNGPVSSHGDVTEAQIATEVEMLSNQDLLTKVVEKCSLVEGPRADDPRAIEKAVRKLKKTLRVTPGVRSDLIRISYSSESPDKAVQVLNTLMTDYLDTHLQMHRAAGSFEFFREQANHYDEELREAQTRLAEFEVRTKVVVLDEQKDLNLRKLSDLEASLDEAEAAEGESQKRNERIRSQIGGVAERIITQTRHLPNEYSVERLTTMLVDLNNKRLEMLVKFKPDDRMVKEVDEQIHQTQIALERAKGTGASEEATDVNPLRQALQSDLLASESRLEGLRGRVETLHAHVAGYRKQLDQLEIQTGAHDKLARAVKEAESRYLLYSRQFEEAEIAAEMDQRRMANLAVAEQPTTPGAARPKVDSTILIGAALAVFVWNAFLFIRGLRRPCVFTPWELEGVLGIPVLGALPLDQKAPLLLSIRN